MCVLPLVAIGALLAAVIRMPLDVIPSPTPQKRLSLLRPVRKRGIIKKTPPLPLALHKAAGEWRYGVFEEPRPSSLPNIPPFPLPSVGGEPARLLIAMIYNCGMTGREMDSRGREKLLDTLTPSHFLDFYSRYGRKRPSWIKDRIRVPHKRRPMRMMRFILSIERLIYTFSTIVHISNSHLLVLYFIDIWARHVCVPRPTLCIFLSFVGAIGKRRSRMERRKRDVWWPRAHSTTKHIPGYSTLRGG